MTEELHGRMGGSSRRIALGPGREFDLIRGFLGREDELGDGVLVGPGDDCAVLEGGFVASVDLTVEGVHYRPEWITPEDVGFRAAASALSDLAAMAATPLGILLSVALNPETTPEEGGRVVEGAREACRRQGVGILGGDLTRSPGPLVVDAVVLGRAENPVLRVGSEPGDEIWVTGRLGGSAAAVRAWTLGEIPTPGLRDAFARPTPRIQEAIWLARELHLHALIDLSDGLAGDAGHLAAASGVGMVLEEGALPFHPELAREAGDHATAVGLALSGGEDYELCFTVGAGVVDEEQVGAFQDLFHLPLTRVGRVTDEEGVFLHSSDGDLRRMDVGGFQHFHDGETA